MAAMAMVAGGRQTAGRRAAPEPIDLVHLAKVTFGNTDLEREVLGMFLKQSADLVARIASASESARSDLAHRLKGSARGIGAGRVAEAAEVVETGSGESGRVEAADLARLADAVAEAQAFIRELL